MDRRRNHAPRTQVDVGPMVVVKESGDRPDLEFAKAGAIADLADRHGFGAAAPLSFDVEHGTVTYERIDVGVALGTLVPTGRAGPPPEAILAFEGAGETLGLLHRELDVAGGERVPAPASITDRLGDAARRRLLVDGTADPVVGHGDYSVWNVFTRRGPVPPDRGAAIDDVDEGDEAGAGGRGTTVVLDCCPNGYSSVLPVVHESRYIDLALFDSCLYGRAGLRDHVRIRSRTLAQLRRAFLAGYRRSSDRVVDVRLLRATTRAVLAAYFADRRGWSPWQATLVGRAVTVRHWRS